MARVKRTHFVLLHLSDTQQIDLSALLRGTVTTAPGPPEWQALALLTSRRVTLTREDLDALASVPAGAWTDAAAIGAQAARSLALRGLLVSDEDDPRLRELRARDAALTTGGWNLYAAAYHFMTQREGVVVREDPEPADWQPVDRETVEEFIRLYGPSPPAFHDPAPGAPVTRLARVERQDGLFGALARRRTTRAFDPGRRMTEEQLATVLRYVFGVRGVATTALGTRIRRTSPSAGARHPVEAYPLISGVDGVSEGLYHYDVRGHSLRLLSPMDAADAQSQAASFACGQSFFGSAHVTFILTARFNRSHWKYRRTDRVYAAMMMDAGHLSQTLYLVATELGLGAYVTAAINGADIERRLGLDGCDEGAIALAGCGPPTGAPSPLDLDFPGIFEPVG